MNLLIDLELGKLTRQDVGQMDCYLPMFDAQGRTERDRPTIGWILCGESQTMLEVVGVRIVCSAVRTPNMNAFAERFAERSAASSSPQVGSPPRRVRS